MLCALLAGPHYLLIQCHRVLLSQASSRLRSKTRTEPSAETEAKTPTPPHAMSYTSRSCAISCVSTTPFCAARGAEQADQRKFWLIGMHQRRSCSTYEQAGYKLISTQANYRTTCRASGWPPQNTTTFANRQQRGVDLGGNLCSGPCKRSSTEAQAKPIQHEHHRHSAEHAASQSGRWTGPPRKRTCCSTMICHAAEACLGRLNVEQACQPR